MAWLLTILGGGKRYVTCYKCRKTSDVIDVNSIPFNHEGRVGYRDAHAPLKQAGWREGLCPECSKESDMQVKILLDAYGESPVDNSYPKLRRDHQEAVCRVYEVGVKEGKRQASEGVSGKPLGFAFNVLLGACSPDELAVFHQLLLRVSKGRDVYGPLDLATDKRDFAKEAHDEDLDGTWYRMCEWVKRQREAAEPKELKACTPTGLSMDLIKRDESCACYSTRKGQTSCT